MKKKLFLTVMSLCVIILPELYAQKQAIDSINVISGCTRPNASNFNPQATIDDGSCIFIEDSTAIDSTKIVLGCTNRNAKNYNPLANRNDGSCVFDSTNVVIYGCMNPIARNYNPLATEDNGLCIFVSNDSTTINGCMNPYAKNYNRFANIDDGSCIFKYVNDTILGCTDSLALNFNPIATISNGNCVYITDTIQGCKAPNALNFNSKATKDDGSCIFANPSNVILPHIPSGLNSVVDTLGKVLQRACNFDYSLPIDTAYIGSSKHTNQNEVEINWVIKQGALITNLKITYEIQKTGFTLIYLSLVCNNGSQSVSAARVSYVTRQMTSGLSLVNGVTLAAYYENKIKTGLANTPSTISGITIYPNPVNNQLNINYVSSNNENLQLNIYSVGGQKVMSSKVTSIIGSNQFEINTSTLESGIHFITISKNGIIIDKMKFAKF